ncbi:hypothetical protein ETB97_008463 [Aspergillus alliaceus]|uniref:Uncharacterized protein n=1 Tax=Petromyces alliaceus TaxID=209559 RepID=A0A8H5ZXM3_PETAA|nr:hypothetical protein ETB97_008463 [Aspergillus burnettii]
MASLCRSVDCIILRLSWGRPLVLRLERASRTNYGHILNAERVGKRTLNIEFYCSSLVFYSLCRACLSTDDVRKPRHWIAVDIGAASFNLGMIMTTQSFQQYVMEAFQGHVASAGAASRFLRNIFAFCFPLFAPAMYRHLGLGWGNCMLAFIFLVIGVAAPFILWIFGAGLRAKGKSML